MELRCEMGQHLSEAERSVIDYINKQRYIISLLSISDIAEGAFVSNATVSRAIRKCGFSSFSEMKFRLAESENEDRDAYKMNRILSMSYTECMETIKRIDIPSIIESVRLIREAKVVYLLANGLTALQAEEFKFQLQCQKINVCMISDAQMMKRMDLLVTEQDLVIIISVKNSAPELAEAAKLSRKKGAKVISFCCTHGTLLDSLSDFCIYGYTQSICPNELFGATSRLGLMIITRTVVEYMMTGPVS